MKQFQFYRKTKWSLKKKNLNKRLKQRSHVPKIKTTNHPCQLNSVFGRSYANKFPNQGHAPRNNKQTKISSGNTPKINSECRRNISRYDQTQKKGNSYFYREYPKKFINMTNFNLSLREGKAQQHNHYLRPTLNFSVVSSSMTFYDQSVKMS